MNALLAFPVFIHRAEAGMHAPNTAAMDWFVIATLCCLFFLLGCFATAAWQIWRRTTRPEPHMKLLMELEGRDEDKTGRSTEEQSGRQGQDAPKDPWERPPDWWKE